MPRTSRKKPRQKQTLKQNLAMGKARIKSRKRSSKKLSVQETPQGPSLSRTPSKTPSQKPSSRQGSKQPSQKPSRRHPSKSSKQAQVEAEEYLEQIGIDMSDVNTKVEDTEQFLEITQEAAAKQDLETPAFQFILSSIRDKVKQTAQTSKKKLEQTGTLIESFANSQLINDVVDNFNAYFARPDVDFELEEFLNEHGLMIKEDRMLETTCHYIELKTVPNHLTKHSLEDFLSTHPGHHLGIFSIKRDDSLECYFINDLHALVTTTTSHGWSQQEVDLITHWYTAYHQLLSILKDHQQRDKITHLSRLLQPAPAVQKGFVAGVKNLFHKGTKFLKKTFNSMWNVLKLKVISDLVYSVWCFFIKSLTYYRLMDSENLLHLFWGVARDFFIGEFIQRCAKTISSLYSGAGTTLPGVLDSVNYGLKTILPEKWYKTLSYLLTGFYAVAPKVTTLATNALFGTLLGTIVFAIPAALATGPLGIGLASQAVLSFSAVGAFGIQAFLTAVAAELSTRVMSSVMDVLNPLRGGDFSGLSFLLPFASPSVFCSVISGKHLPKTKQLCEKLLTTLVGMRVLLGVVGVVVDIIVDLFHAQGHLKDYPTRCSNTFAKNFYHQTYEAGYVIPERSGKLFRGLPIEVPVPNVFGLREDFGGHGEIVVPEVLENLHRKTQ